MCVFLFGCGFLSFTFLFYFNCDQNIVQHFYIYKIVSYIFKNVIIKSIVEGTLSWCSINFSQLLVLEKVRQSVYRGICCILSLQCYELVYTNWISLFSVINLKLSLFYLLKTWPNLFEEVWLNEGKYLNLISPLFFRLNTVMLRESEAILDCSV